MANRRGMQMYKWRGKETVGKGYGFELVPTEIPRINHERG